MLNHKENAFSKLYFEHRKGIFLFSYDNDLRQIHDIADEVECACHLQRHAVLEDGDFAVVVLLVAGFLAAGHGQYLVDELRH